MKTTNDTVSNVPHFPPKKKESASRFSDKKKNIINTLSKRYSFRLLSKPTRVHVGGADGCRHVRYHTASAAIILFRRRRRQTANCLKVLLKTTPLLGWVSRISRDGWWWTFGAGFKPVSEDARWHHRRCFLGTTKPNEGTRSHYFRGSEKDSCALAVLD